MNSTNSWRRSRLGLTLIEVVAATVILGTLLVGVVLVKSRHTHQLAVSARQRAAVRAADELISGWWHKPRGVPIGECGTIPTDESLVWETRLVENREVSKMGGQVVRVSVRSAKSTTVEPTADEATVAVELVVPDPDHKWRNQPTTAPATEPAQGANVKSPNAHPEVPIPQEAPSRGGQP